MLIQISKDCCGSFKKLGCILLIQIILLFIITSCCLAGPAENAAKYYSKAESQFSNIYKPGFRENRQNWVDCAESFKKAYDSEPDGDYAPVSLYFYGKVYRDLFKFSGNQNDIDIAEKAFKKVSSSFPKSTFSHKAETELDNIQGLKQAKGASSAEVAQNKDKSPNNSIKDTKDDKTTNNLQQPKSIRSTEPAADRSSAKTNESPKSKADAPNEVGVKKETVSKQDNKTDTKKASVTGIRHWTENGYTRVVVDADSKVMYKYYVDKKKKDGLEFVVFEFKNCAAAPKLKREITFQGKIAKNAVLKESNGDLTLRIGVVTSENFNVFPLSGQSDKLKYRIVIDLKGEQNSKNENTAAKKSAPEEKTDKDKKINSSQTSVQSVEDTKKENSGQTQKDSQPATETKENKDKQAAVKSSDSSNVAAVTDYDAQLQKSGRGRINPGALTKQLALGVRRIVIDPGHGGNDPGAMAPKGIREKDITLALAKRLAVSLKNRTGCEVYLTRSTDKYLHLEERTAIANTQKADLFISLHLNSSPAKEAFGIETYFLNLATDESAIAVAARENATSTKNISDLEGILKDLMRNAKIDESSRMAKYVQKNICSNLSRRFSPIKDKGVKQAPFYVLIGAQMPAILIETGFISNAQELERLGSPGYQAEMSNAIAEGVAQYISSVNSPYPTKPSTKKTGGDKKNTKNESTGAKPKSSGKDIKK